MKFIVIAQVIAVIAKWKNFSYVYSVNGEPTLVHPLLKDILIQFHSHLARILNDAV